MLGRRLAVALLVVLGGAQSLWAGPFSEVPSGHWAYAACARLAETQVLAEKTATFSGKPQLTRFEFGVSILSPLAEVDRAVGSLPAGSDETATFGAAIHALGISPRLPEREIARAASDLRRLAVEFGEVLSELGFSSARALRALQTFGEGEIHAWRVEALSPPLRPLSLVPTRRASDSFRLPVGPGTVAFSYGTDPRYPEILDYLAAAAADLANPPKPGSAEPALRDPTVSRLRTAYEYGLGSALTLSLAYEEIARSGQGLEPLDSASLASFGIGYQLTPNTSVKVSYSLLEYSSHALGSQPLRDRVAETAVSIGF